jgi:hypothetical protein
MQGSYFKIVFDPHQYQAFRLDHYEIEIKPWYQSNYETGTTLSALRLTMSSAEGLNPSIMDKFKFTTVLQSAEFEQTVRVGRHFFDGHPADIKIALQNLDPDPTGFTEHSTLFDSTKHIQLSIDVIKADDGIEYSLLP